MRTRFAYLMRKVDEDTLMPAYKIGMSYDPHARAKKCRAELIAFGPGGWIVEHQLHEKFAHLRLGRPHFEAPTEWFVDDDGSIHEYLKGLA